MKEEVAAHSRRQLDFPAKAGVHGKVRTNLPAVLAVKIVLGHAKVIAQVRTGWRVLVVVLRNESLFDVADATEHVVDGVVKRNHVEGLVYVARNVVIRRDGGEAGIKEN
jgi:hypothetical protein